MSAPLWLPPPQPVMLGYDDVHVWRADLDRVAVAGWEMLSALEPAEQARAARLRFASDRVRFIAGRAVLRSILARYLAVTAERIRLDYTEHGKPYLAGERAERAYHLEFNMTHSAGLALYAVTLGRPVGIDVEQLRAVRETDVIVSSFFSPDESHSFRQLPTEQQEIAFFHGWTRKEAWLKATGEGLAHPAGLVEVSLAPGEAPELRRIDGDPLAAAAWSLIDLEPGQGFLGALAVRGCGWRLSQWEYGAAPVAQNSRLDHGAYQYGRPHLS